MQLLDGALGCWRGVAVIAGIAHTCRGVKQQVTQNSLNSSSLNRLGIFRKLKLLFLLSRTERFIYVYIYISHS